MIKLNKERQMILADIKRKNDEKVVRKILKRFVKNQLRDVKDSYEQKSLMDMPRKYWESYDGYVEYGLYELTEAQKNMSEKELRDLIYEEFAIPEWHSQYDCTGKAFTQFINFHKNPCGLVSIIHHVGFDV